MVWSCQSIWVSVIDMWPVRQRSLVVSQKASLGNKWYRLAISMELCDGFHAMGWNISTAITNLCTVSFITVASIRNYQVSDIIDSHQNRVCHDSVWWMTLSFTHKALARLVLLNSNKWRGGETQWYGNDFINGVPQSLAPVNLLLRHSESQNVFATWIISRHWDDGVVFGKRSAKPC